MGQSVVGVNVADEVAAVFDAVLDAVFDPVVDPVVDPVFDAVVGAVVCATEFVDVVGLLAAFATAAVLFRRAAIVPPTDPPTAAPMTTIQITLIINQNVVAFMLPTRFGSPRGDSSMWSISSFSLCKGGVAWGGVETSSPS